MKMIKAFDSLQALKARLLTTALLVTALFAATVPALAQTGPASYRVNTVAALVQITLFGTSGVAWVGGGAALDDGLGGVFFYDSAATTATNVYAVFKPVNNDGRWFKLPTSVAWQTDAVTVATDTTYAWKLLRGVGQTNFLGFGADNNIAYIQTFNGKNLHINNQGNHTILNSTAGNVGIGPTAPTSKFHLSGVNIFARLQTTTDTGAAALQFADEGDVIKYVAGYRDSTGNYEISPGTIIGAATALTVDPLGNLAVRGTLAVGGGASIRAIYSAAATLNFPAIDSGSATNLTIAVAGAGTNSVVTVSPAGGSLTEGVVPFAFVDSTNSVTIRMSNFTAGSVDPATAALRVAVIQFQ